MMRRGEGVGGKVLACGRSPDACVRLTSFFTI